MCEKNIESFGTKSVSSCSQNYLEIYKYTHCHQIGHTKSQSFELVGYPEWQDHSRDPRMKNSRKIFTLSIVETKTKDDIVEKASVSIAALDNGGKVLNISTSIYNNTWIIDFGATYRSYDI